MRCSGNGGCSCEIADCFKKEQPVIDSERQLSGKVVNDDTRGALERSDQITLEQLCLIDAILTLPETVGITAVVAMNQ